MTTRRLKAALHEVCCWECRVTWTSWAQRLIGLQRGHTPKLSKRHRALVERAHRAEAAVERVRTLAQAAKDYRTSYMFGGIPAPVLVRADDVLAALDPDQPKETP